MKSMVSWHVAVASLAIGLLGAGRLQHGPQEPPFRPERPIVIQGGILIEATGAPPRLDYAVLIEGERITELGPMESVGVPEGAEIIDATGMTIMPGLINSNQHLQLNPLGTTLGDLPVSVLRSHWEDNYSRMPQLAFVYLMQGVTSMRQTSGPASRLLPIKRAIDAGEIPGPRIFLGGALFQHVIEFTNCLTLEGTPPEAHDWKRYEFAYNVIEDADKDTDAFLGPDFSYWKLLTSDEQYDARNDFSDDQLRFIINKAHPWRTWHPP